MRQIKFRGKRLDNGEWVYGDLLQICGGYIIYYGSQTESDEFEDDGKTAIYLYKNEVSPVHPDTVGQFTGLHDCNGKDIYEGDIVLNGANKYRVEYDENHVCWMAAYNWPDSVGNWQLSKEHCAMNKVIGNIHD